MLIWPMGGNGLNVHSENSNCPASIKKSALYFRSTRVIYKIIILNNPEIQQFRIGVKFGTANLFTFLFLYNLFPGYWIPPPIPDSIPWLSTILNMLCRQSLECQTGSFWVARILLWGAKNGKLSKRRGVLPGFVHFMIFAVWWFSVNLRQYETIPW